ncbi:MAG: mannitol-1-phosphate 5-dehydrogenase [Candidatus Omnitrophica bacterium]|nr:mannitol-1-phosphate 5-dehydrogenase [Candidatus Omnitrophota bacterium]MCM8802762.1 mannitol-1-phosphate 5-dehydrogenase [Candidatus Omnitrophota bacterium]
MDKIIIFGAGQIGRGFIGELCYDSGLFIIFVDIDENIINLLNKEKTYLIYLLGKEKIKKTITNFEGLHLKKDKDKIVDEIAKTSIIFTSVGAKNLFTLSEIIAEGIKEKFRGNKSYLNIIICENLLSAGKKFKEQILNTNLFSNEEKKFFQEKVGFVETVISRMTSPLTEIEKKENPLLVKVEPYKILPVDKNSFKGKLPKIVGLLPVENLKKYEELKLFGHNLSHVCLAYYGFLKGYKYIWECMEDKEIIDLLLKVQGEIKKYLIKKYNFSENELNDYFKDLNERFKNKLLSDTVFRVGREPLRKIGKEERIIGAIKGCLEFNIFPKNICFVMAMALCYNFNLDEESVKLQNIIKEKGFDFVLNEICEINNIKIIETIKKYYKEIKSESSNFKGN